jgi:Tfp pilus assembly protein PilO
MKKELSTPVKVGLLVAGVVLALVAGWFLVVSPKRSEAQKLQDDTSEVQAKIALAEEARDHPQAAAGSAIRIADLFELSRAMPDRADVPGVLLQLSRVADETGVVFDSISPQDPVQEGVYQKIDFDLVFEGRFYDLSDFLYRLRNLVGVHDGVLNATGRLFTVGSISFDQGTNQFPQVKATLTLSAYVFGDGTTPITPSTGRAAGAGAPSASAVESSHPIPATPAATRAGA